ncbi:MAG TPA: hypothetical protein IAA23_00970 [Candidatus Helicobacter avistercoris]|nr:hypothetical protein [Candidatus Helicobacter avistercoris]
MDIATNTTETVADLNTFTYSIVNLDEGSTLNLGNNGDGRLDPLSPITINFNGANSKIYGGSTNNGLNNINVNVAKTGAFYLPSGYSNGTLYLKSLSLQDGSSMSFVGGCSLEIQNLISEANTTLVFGTNNQTTDELSVKFNNQINEDTL